MSEQVKAPAEVGPDGSAREFQWWQLRPPERLPRKRVMGLAVLGVLILAALAYGAYYWHWSQLHVSTDDAFISGHISPVSARVGGTVIAVLVDDNQDVKVGDVLVRLDARDYEVARAQARAAVEAARGELENATTTVPLTDDTTRSLLHEADASLGATAHGATITEHDLEQRRSELASKQAAIAAADSAVQGAEADFQRARQDRERAADLLKQGLIAQQDYDHADAAFKTAQAAVDMARHKLAQARDDARQAAAAVRSQDAAVAQARQRIAQAQAAVANARSPRQQVKVREAQVAAARGRLELALANLQQAQLNLDYTTIRSPVAGRVTKKAVEVGQIATAGQPLLSLVDLDNVWVVANYKETQLTDVRPGQHATIEVDTYPGHVFKGHVDSIQGGSGAVFSLLPPENATGNYVKVVQRVPVKIVFNQPPDVYLGPGMSVVPDVKVR